MSELGPPNSPGIFQLPRLDSFSQEIRGSNPDADIIRPFKKFDLYDFLNDSLGVAEVHDE